MSNILQTYRKDESVIQAANEPNQLKLWPASTPATDWQQWITKNQNQTTA